MESQGIICMYYEVIVWVCLLSGVDIFLVVALFPNCKYEIKRCHVCTALVIRFALFLHLLKYVLSH